MCALLGFNLCGNEYLYFRCVRPPLGDLPSDIERIGPLGLVYDACDHGALKCALTACLARVQASLVLNLDSVIVSDAFSPTNGSLPVEVQSVERAMYAKMAHTRRTWKIAQNLTLFHPTEDPLSPT